MIAIQSIEIRAVATVRSAYSIETRPITASLAWLYNEWIPVHDMN